MNEDNATSAIDGGEGQPKTPYAFGKKVKDPDDVSYSEKIEEMLGRLLEVSYKDYKNDSGQTERQKINTNILEINKRLREVEQMLNHASKLKTETNASQDIFWKGTVGKFSKINERLIRLSNKIREMNT